MISLQEWGTTRDYTEQNHTQGEIVSGLAW